MHIVSSDGLQFRSEHFQAFGREVSEELDYRNGSESVQYRRHEREVFASAELLEAATKSEPKLSQEALQQYADSLPAPSDIGNSLDIEQDEAGLAKLRLLLSALARLNNDFERFAGM